MKLYALQQNAIYTLENLGVVSTNEYCDCMKAQVELFWEKFEEQWEWSCDNEACKIPFHLMTISRSIPSTNY